MLVKHMVYLFIKWTVSHAGSNHLIASLLDVKSMTSRSQVQHLIITPSNHLLLAYGNVTL